MGCPSQSFQPRPFAHDVAVRDRVSVRCDDKSRPAATTPVSIASGDADDGRRHRFDHVNYGLGIGVEQISVSRCGPIYGLWPIGFDVGWTIDFLSWNNSRIGKSHILPPRVRDFARSR
jgi:hypothetical protein